MDAMFVVPTLVSPNVNEKLVPPLLKVIERNIILNNSGIFRAAAEKKYGSVLSNLRSEGVEATFEECYMLALNEALIDDEDVLFGSGKNKYTVGQAKQALSTPTAKAASKSALNRVGKSVVGDLKYDEAEMDASEAKTRKIDDIEVPKHVKFFTSISLEPTYLEIPIYVKTGKLSTNKVPRYVRIGVKAVPYTVNDVRSLLPFMNQLQSKGIVERLFFRVWNNILKKIPLTKWSRIYKGKTGDTLFGEEEPNESIYDRIIFTPSYKQLSSSSVLKGLMSAREARSWTSMVVFSTSDFTNVQMQKSMERYRRLVSAGWGDMLIVNEPKESVHFCTQKLGACYELSFAYLRQILNLNNVLDYTELNKWTRPFNTVRPTRSIFNEGEQQEKIRWANNTTHDNIMRIIKD